MIPRYSRQEMTNIWSDTNKYNIWLNIEIFALEAMEKIGLVPSGTSLEIKKNAKFDISKIEEIEKTTKHDVIAFLTNLSESIGENSRFVHMGMTSSDILDTCLSKQLLDSSNILLSNIDNLLNALKDKAIKYKDTICAGRSHGIHGEPITFGLKMARFYEEFKRSKKRLLNAKDEISYCMISGAMGTFATIDPFIQEYVAKKMGLHSENISTQIISRDRHAFFISTLGVIASSIENISVEIRHLQRSEVLEVEESFSKGQKGSSAMPHKKNPILSENLTGLSRIVRAAVVPCLENVTLWHERDISHSSVERTLVPDAIIALDFALNRLTNVVTNLVVHPKKMQENLEKLNGLIFSQRVLLFLINKADFSREKAYSIIQRNAMKSWNNESSFLSLLLEDQDVSKVASKKEVEDLFDYSFYTKNLNKIFDNIF